MEGKFRFLADNWEGGPCVARTDVHTFSGGMLNPKTMANLDSLGEGPRQVRFGKKVFYKMEDLIQWMEQREKAA